MQFGPRITQEIRDGTRVWRKRAAKDHRNAFQRFLCLLNPERAQLQREAASIGALRRRGAYVPELLEIQEDSLLLSDLGPTLEALLHTVPIEETSFLLAQAAKALEMLHRAGGWHGNAMLRNLTSMPDGTIGMFDFEYGIPHCLPLRLKQAYDLWQISRASLSFDPSGELVVSILGHYHFVGPRSLLLTLCHALTPVAALFAPVSPYLGRDAVRAVLSVRCIRRAAS